jgi:hypothetical protein
MPARLPDLDRRQTTAFLSAFTTKWEHRGGSLIVGVGRDGHPFSFHAKHPLSIRRDFLGRILRQLNVSRDEFDAWFGENG